MEQCIELKDVSVRYYLPKERINTLKEYAIRCFRSKVEYEQFWALNKVSLRVNKGERIGIVGVNGAGKSTLLKVVAGVMKPIEGLVNVSGRVTPLTQLGAGFNSELTGRENIYLNGAIFGWSRKEMDKKFDSIVNFSELGDFIKAPLRTYSSGMVARLGFATAIQVEPDILLLDEVLAVGDGAFQKKCLDEINRFKAKGVTILFVSHAMDQVRRTCEKALWLDRGAAKAWGDSDSVLKQYEQYMASLTKKN